MQDDRQRVDRWLWHARVVRTRVLAAKLAASGHVRVNGERISAPGRAVRLGDVLTIALPGAVRVLRIAGLAPRRGSAAETQGLYDDLKPPAPPQLPSAPRESGSGRPTKRERRQIERLRQRGFTCDV